MRITQKIFVDLTIFMVGLGVIVGLVFPFFCTFLGVPKEIVFRPLFFFSMYGCRDYFSHNEYFPCKKNNWDPYKRTFSQNVGCRNVFK